MPDRFPGPVVESRSGDTMIISVENQLEDESITIHWHGLHLRSKIDLCLFERTPYLLFSEPAGGGQAHS
jgi:FtsP/CotA-like multicopper oxidase with cupredoxin domain